MTDPLFIAIDGADGSGLSTQTSLLHQTMQQNGKPSFATKEPSTGPVGAVARLAQAHRLVTPASAPLNEQTMALIYAADRMDHLASDIEPRLAEGISVVTDRYALSSFAFQSLGVDLQWIRHINAKARIPDLTIFIDVPPPISIERIQSRGSIERYEVLSTLERVHANFHEVIPILRVDGWRIEIVDGTGLPQDVHKIIRAFVG